MSICETQDQLESLAAGAGWTSDTLLLLISTWAEEAGFANLLLGYLSRLAADEDDQDDGDDSEDAPGI